MDLALDRRKIEENSRRDDVSGCWIWKLAVHKDGYGRAQWGGKCRNVHNVAYEAFIGPIPKRHLVLHTCGVNNCVNPGHLYLSSLSEKYAQSISPEDAKEMIRSSSSLETDSGCWLWEGTVDKDGYGKMSWLGKDIRAHRLSYQTFIGPIPKGQFILHRCHRPSCVNPEHLYAGTHHQNMDDMTSALRQAKGADLWTNKLSEDDISKVFALRESGMTQTEIANQFGVSQVNISCILTGKTWKHLR